MISGHSKRIKRAVLGVALLLSLVVVASAIGGHGHHKRVKMADINAITLTQGKMTTGRRNSPIPQLTCMGGPCREWSPRTVLCTNKGSDGLDAVWTCESDMPRHLKFGTVEVACEGYDYPDDKYILAGSCGLEYYLERSGEPAAGAPHNTYHTRAATPGVAASSSSGFGSFLMVIVLVGVLLCVLRCCSTVGRAGGGGGGAGGVDDDQPGARPRAYDAPPPYSAAMGSSGYSSSGSSTFGAPSYTAPRASSGPGFFSGMAAGGALGYMAGRRNTPAAAAPAAAPSYAPSYSSSYDSSSSSGGGAEAHRSASGGTRRR